MTQKQQQQQQTVEHANETKSRFSEKINKIDIPLTRAITKKEKGPKQIKSRNRRDHNQHHRNTNNFKEKL